MQPHRTHGIRSALGEKRKGKAFLKQARFVNLRTAGGLGICVACQPAHDCNIGFSQSMGPIDELVVHGQ